MNQGNPAYVFEPVEVREVRPEEIYHDTIEDRFGPLVAAMAQQGRSLSEAFGANERGLDAIRPDGTIMEEPRVPPDFGPTQQRQRLVNPQAPNVMLNQPVDARTQSPYDALPSIEEQQAAINARYQQPPTMTQDQYLAMIQGATPQAQPNEPQVVPFGPARTPQEVYLSQQLGELRNQMGEMRRMVEAVIAPQQRTRAIEQIRAATGLDKLDPETPLTAREMTEILGNFGGFMYNELSQPANNQGADPAATAVARRDGMLPPTNAPATQSGYYGAGHVQNAPARVAPERFVERGAQIPGFDPAMRQPQGPRPGSALSTVLEKRSRGEFVSTKEYAMALREQGYNIPVRR